ncbi:MAG: hypothetical protein HGA65_20175 [Oscillochloris sp.]|nr:hypothetical protein [Oscillochloris sp.]
MGIVRQTDAQLASTLGLPAIYAAQVGQIEDMNRIATDLVAAFPAE